MRVDMWWRLGASSARLQCTPHAIHPSLGSPQWFPLWTQTRTDTTTGKVSSLPKNCLIFLLSLQPCPSPRMDLLSVSVDLPGRDILPKQDQTVCGHFRLVSFIQLKVFMIDANGFGMNQPIFLFLAKQYSIVRMLCSIIFCFCLVCEGTSC